MDIKFLAEQIFKTAVESVLPEKMIHRHVALKNSILCISGMPIPLDNINHIYLIGAGKASAAMAKEFENILGKKISGGHVVVKYGHACKLQYVDLSEAGHPIPDINGQRATKKILDIAKHASENDLVICLISGGGSALLTDIPDQSKIEDIINLNDLLLKSSADIKEINTVRKHLSKIKGGQLATAAYPARLICLILSDVVGDLLDVIASGPTVPDTTTYEDALKVLEKYNLLSWVPNSLINYLEKGKEGIYPETPKTENPLFNRTQNVVIGSNKIALDAANQKATSLGLNSFVSTSELAGNVIETAHALIKTAITAQNDKGIKKPYCLLFGGETTIKINGTGTGGRNQHLALYASLLLKDKNGITFLAAGTDGTDGPTVAAGAVVNTKTFEHALSIGLNINQYLENFDSFHFFEKVGGHIITGPTMTNVMDIIIIIIE